jgi:hypothetical protein
MRDRSVLFHVSYIHDQHCVSVRLVCFFAIIRCVCGLCDALESRFLDLQTCYELHSMCNILLTLLWEAVKILLDFEISLFS